MLAAFLVQGARHFALDASSDTLVLEGDADLSYAQSISERYGGGEAVVVTFSPPGDLLAPAALNELGVLRDELAALPRVASVTSLLDVPLLRNPPVPLSELRSNLKTLEDPDVDIELARTELASSPIYQELIVSSDLRSTALQVDFRVEEAHEDLAQRVQVLALEKSARGLTSTQAEELESLRAEYALSKSRRQDELHEDIASIRAILERHREESELFLGGVPMIVDDIVSYIRADIAIFGVGILGLLGATLLWAFRQLRWVVLPLLCCFYSVLAMVGLLGWLGWPVTVVSSNFISLQLIFTLSLAIHIIVRGHEQQREEPGLSSRELMLKTVGHTFVPCFYASLTTIAGFSSLALCDVLPVSSFGRMMTMGVAVSLVVTFTLFPAALTLMSSSEPAASREHRPRLTAFFARLTERHGTGVLVVSALVALLTALGVSQLKVENSFIDYFKENSEIYQGMEFIDRRLGGTTPLDIILDFPQLPEEEATALDAPAQQGAEAPGFDEFDEFSEFESEEADTDAETYWYTATKLERIERVHRYLDACPETGKVMSLATLSELGRDANQGEPLDDLLRAILFQQMPESVRGVLVTPYASVEHNQARVNARVRDSLEGLERNALLERIRSDLGTQLELKEGEYHVSGLMVLYNNMLQSLFRAQVSTVGYTVAVLLAMFCILFRSIRVALIAILPSLLSSLVVLGVMGLGGIPLDVMTITIVAIGTGIAVDDTIHYLHRFRRELEHDGDYLKSMHRCHTSIGNAMYFTTLAITLGFSVLAFSNFVPSILFGLLTALAMVMALIASLTLLPRLLLVLRPFETKTAGD